MKLRKKLKIKPQDQFIIILISIIILAFWMIHSFNKKISPKMINIVEMKINKLSNDIIMDSFNNQLLKDHDINKIIKITKNKNDEIIAVDFDLDKAYQVSMNVSKNIKKSLTSIENNYLEEEDVLKYSNDGYILLLPMGLSSNNIYLSNLGPKVPVKIKFIGNLVTGLKTKVKDYGINNSLIEVYMKVSLNEEILIPYVNKKINNDCEILLSSQIVEGIVPSLYNGLLENNSSLINIPLDN